MYALVFAQKGSSIEKRGTSAVEDSECLDTLASNRSEKSKSLPGARPQEKFEDVPQQLRDVLYMGTDTSRTRVKPGQMPRLRLQTICITVHTCAFKRKIAMVSSPRELCGETVQCSSISKPFSSRTLSRAMRLLSLCY